MIDFNHFAPQKVSTAVLKAQVFISSRSIRFSVIFKIISINQDWATLAEKIKNIPAAFPNRMSVTVKIVIVFLQNCYCLSFLSNSAFFSLSICINSLLVATCISMISTME